MHIFYLHGFASSPMSTKAQFLAERLAVRGLTLQCPDFNQPDFSTLTVSRMLQQIEKRIEMMVPGNVVLIGSSMGGFVAVEAAARAVNQARHPITQLILLAPAVELEWERLTEVGPGEPATPKRDSAKAGIERWRRRGSIEVFHYAYDEPRRLAFSFYEDAISYAPARRRLETPMVIVQGRRDESVDPAGVERFAKAQPLATLHMVDDDHQLKNSLEAIWVEIARLLPMVP
ncbi:MAG: alpha/beta fold hydrolase [Verrucomicrobia bacterium]|nr:MAG: alpha/beta fold hydrolase [Verrucomicrobiota bacterium]